jgi:hypothetical protein
MKLESRKEEQLNEPLSTAALAHADERREPENRAVARDRDPLTRPEPEPVVQDPDRQAIDGGPSLIRPSTSKVGEPGRVQSWVNGTADRRPEVAGKMADDEQNTPLFSGQESKELYAKWDALQVSFIDEPRRAVQQVDNLVATAMKRTAEVFAEERARLERQWDRGDDVSTEDLRLAMRRYRSFFRRLLAV